MIAAGLNAVLNEAVAEYVENSRMACEIIGCNLNSPGFRCGCGRLLCRSHVYFKLSERNLKPEAICPSCVADENPELFED